MWKFLLKKWKGLDTKKKLIVLGVATVIALFPVIFIVVLISPLMSLDIIDISGMGGSSGIGYSTNTYLQKVNDECKSIVVDNQIYSLEDYVKGVVSAEAYTGEGMEALKAQAIAARTFAIKKTNNCDGNPAESLFQIRSRHIRYIYSTYQNRCLQKALFIL